MFILITFFLSKINYDTYGSIDYYDRYGIHFNLKGTIELSEDYEKPKLVLTNGITEIDLKAKLENYKGDLKLAAGTGSSTKKNYFQY